MISPFFTIASWSPGILRDAISLWTRRSIATVLSSALAICVVRAFALSARPPMIAIRPIAAGILFSILLVIRSLGRNDALTERWAGHGHRLTRSLHARPPRLGQWYAWIGERQCIPANGCLKGAVGFPSLHDREEGGHFAGLGVAARPGSLDRRGGFAIGPAGRGGGCRRGPFPQGAVH